MIFRQTHCRAHALIEPERHCDERGFFARTWCREEFVARASTLSWCSAVCRTTCGGERFAACTTSARRMPSTSWCAARAARCAMCWSICAPIRPNTAAGRHSSCRPNNRLLLFVPPGVAHGFLTLTDDCEVFYQMSETTQPSAAAGVRYDDPAVGLSCPSRCSVIAQRDLEFPDFAEVPMPADNALSTAAACGSAGARAVAGSWVRAWKQPAARCGIDIRDVRSSSRPAGAGRCPAVRRRTGDRCHDALAHAAWLDVLQSVHAHLPAHRPLVAKVSGRRPSDCCS